jgi:hypothetical protein
MEKEFLWGTKAFPSLVFFVVGSDMVSRSLTMSHHVVFWDRHDI